MTEASTSPEPNPSPRNTDVVQAGALLRAARQQQGLHIAALAASIKVTPAKLEALESGRIDELPDATFARALALTICRVLKTDPAPVLALMPGAPPGSLARVDSGLNTPYRERSRRDDPAAWLPWRHPVLWLAGLLLVAAAAFVLVPNRSGLLPSLPTLDGATSPVMPPSGAGGPIPAAGSPLLQPADAASAVVVGGAVDAGTAAPLSVPVPVGAAGQATATTPAATPAAAGDTLVVRAMQATWVQATDGSGQTLMARLVPAGETVTLNPVLPVRLRIGNARGTELQFRGQPVDLSATGRDNIANITLP